MLKPENLLNLAKNFLNQNVHEALERTVFNNKKIISESDFSKFHVDSVRRVIQYAVSNKLVIFESGYYKLSLISKTGALELLTTLGDSDFVQQVNSNSDFYMTMTEKMRKVVLLGIELNIFTLSSNRIQISKEVEPFLNESSSLSMHLWIQNFIKVSSKLFSVPCLISAIETGQVQWANAFGATVTNPFDLMSSHPELFKNLMEGMHQSNVTDSNFVTPLLPLKNCKTILDVGGASGAMGLSICHHHLQITQYMIYDLAEAVSLYEAMFERYRDQKNIPVKFRKGDFFAKANHLGLFCLDESEKFDVVILGWIIHDWNDEDATKILIRSKQHLAQGGKLILLEAVLPDDRLGSVTMLDLTMLVQTGGRERTISDFENLLKRSGLKMTAEIDTNGRRKIIVSEAI